MTFDPSKEEWSAAHCWIEGASGDTVGEMRCDDMTDPNDVTGNGRARLASAAPDMARVLMAIEWSCIGPGEQACPWCGAFEVQLNANKPSRTHVPDCALDAALRKAGLR